MMTVFSLSACATAAALLLGAGLLHLLPRVGPLGRAVAAVLCRAPWLDGVMTYFVAGPLLAGPSLGGWPGLAGAVVGQMLALWTWIVLHERVHPAAPSGPRIYRTLDGIVGPWRNHTALWITAIGVPILWVIRLQQLVFYPMLVALLGFPRYRQAEWVNLSRHKFDGLVGYDLVWCLYCDWMTGVWSLGTEMLRNVESFWCPIRFASGKKCDTCKLDFPDVAGAWVPAEASMADVAETLQAMHGGKYRSWFGHPERVGLEVIAATAPTCCQEPIDFAALTATVLALPPAERHRLTAALLGDRKAG